MSLLSLVLYIPLQVVFIPLAIVGVVRVADKQMVVSKRLGLSQMAIEVINGRWTMHVFGVREDDVFEKLVEAGYDPTVKTIFLWEGVTLYLTEQAVRRTMREVRAHAAPGSGLLAECTPTARAQQR